MVNNIEWVNLPSGRNIPVSTTVYNNHYLSFTGYQHFYFNTLINSALFFPQIMQFVFVMISICNGYVSFGDIFMCNLVSGVVWTFVWYFFKLHKYVPGICALSCFIGGNLFRYKLHFVAIAAVSFLVIENWKVILYCAIGGIVAGIIRPLLVGLLSTVKYNDSAIIYVSKFKY